MMKKLYTTLCLSMFLGQMALSATGEGSFTPTSFKIPIYKVTIQKADFTDEQSLYECSGNTNDVCMVDLADASALAAITTAAGTKAIRVGTYPILNIYDCPAGSTGANVTVVKTTGSVDIGGTTYYTQSTGTAGIASGISAAQETQIDTLGCGTVTVYPATPITVTEGSSQNLTITVNLSNILNTSSLTSAGMGGCKAPTGGGRGICTNFPFMIPYVGTGTVTTEKYYIAQVATNTASSLAVSDANGQLLLAVDPNGKPFYAGTVPYYTNTSANVGNSMLYSLSRVSQDDPGQGLRFAYNSTANTVDFLFGGSLDTNGFGVNGFQRANHTGSTAPRTTGTSYYYKAFKQ